jgi:hypothetical protein
MGTSPSLKAELCKSRFFEFRMYVTTQIRTSHFPGRCLCRDSVVFDMPGSTASGRIPALRSRPEIPSRTCGVYVPGLRTLYFGISIMFTIKASLWSIRLLAYIHTYDLPLLVAKSAFPLHPLRAAELRRLSQHNDTGP